MPLVINWMVWIAIFIAIGWFCIHVIRRPHIPIPHGRTTIHGNQGFKRQGCDSCGGMGAYDPTRPGHILRRDEVMVVANQLPCSCCTGLGYHLIKPDYGLVDCA